MSTYIDASGFLAVINRSDQRHENAVSVWQDLVDSGERLVTSNYVLIETIVLLYNRLGTEVVHKFLSDVMPVVEVVWAEVADHTVAAMLASPGKSGPGIVDCMSFHVIRERAIKVVFSYDKHFAGRGFNLIG